MPSYNKFATEKAEKQVQGEEEELEVSRNASHLRISFAQHGLEVQVWSSKFKVFLRNHMQPLHSPYTLYLWTFSCHAAEKNIGVMAIITRGNINLKQDPRHCMETHYRY